MKPSLSGPDFCLPAARRGKPTILGRRVYTTAHFTERNTNNKGFFSGAPIDI